MKYRRTKVVCTIGPASSSPEMLRALIEAGMNVARLNFSHGTHESHAQVIGDLRQLSREMGVRVPILQDLSGPKIRIGKLKGERIELVPESKFVLTSRRVTGDQGSAWVNSPELVEALKSGDRVLLADGELELQVTSKSEADAVCEVIVGGELTSNQGVSAPGVSIKQTVPTEKDLRDLAFGIEQGVDWVAQSFVRSSEEIRILKSKIKEHGSNIPVIVKVEKREALGDLEGIIQEVDGVMVARGDLGLEIPLQEVPLVQKEIIKKANLAGKPVITATQMLESMIFKPRPTRAEVADVANAVFDGTDALMLSGETAAGKYPVQAAKTMVDVALVTEEKIDYVERFRSKPIKAGDDIEDAIAHAAVHMAIEIGARLIVCCTRSGKTARLVAKYRPDATIAVASLHQETLTRSVLLWGTRPVEIAKADNTDQMIASARKASLQAGLAASGDRVVVVAGVPVDVVGTTNMIKADTL
jgi:pyruvate kinase